jgi:hypothetical protein
VLSLGELPEDEIPPARIWHHDKKMQAWFEQVKAHRKDPEEVDLPDKDEEPEQLKVASPAVTNELVPDWVRKRMVG